MTCIAAVVEDGVVYVAGDSAGGSRTSCVTRADPKVFRVGPLVIGGTTSFRMLQLLRFGFNVPLFRTDWSADRMYEWMVTDFIDAVRTRFGAGGFRTRKDEEESGGTFLVAYRDLLFKIDSDFQVGIPALPYTACGCGEDLALGALHALNSLGIPPVGRLNSALYAAAEFSGFVRPPFTILSTEAPQK